MTDGQIRSLIATRGIQLQLIAPSHPPKPVILCGPKGVVYTKRWVVELLLDLSGYCSEKNLVDALAVEPAAGDGAFLGPMIERLVESCRRLGRPLSDCQHSLIAYELDEKSAARARTLAQGILVERGVSRPLAERLAEAWVVTQDYLFDATAEKRISLSGTLLTYGLRIFPKKWPRSTAKRIRRCVGGLISMWLFLKRRFAS